MFIVLTIMYIALGWPSLQSRHIAMSGSPTIYKFYHELITIGSIIQISPTQISLGPAPDEVHIVFKKKIAPRTAIWISISLYVCTFSCFSTSLQLWLSPDAPAAFRLSCPLWQEPSLSQRSRTSWWTRKTCMHTTETVTLNSLLMTWKQMLIFLIRYI